MITCGRGEFRLVVAHVLSQEMCRPMQCVSGLQCVLTSVLLQITRPTTEFVPGFAVSHFTLTSSTCELGFLLPANCYSAFFTALAV